ncbi:hypothetical protein [Sphingomonas sanguinis]|uniref:Uncharacterized protein n=1 Tax=Sphingomonas sanguinis TaxID=33051 RepID=A0A147ITP4_9SPHN|nr:hypothetical protein [Sphingomonas sanguinis]KTT98678.1 hypothetical protein SB4_10525 [Sphingomonas sanguinis]
MIENARKFVDDTGLIPIETDRIVRGACIRRITVCCDPANNNRLVIVADLKDGGFEVFKAGPSLSIADTVQWLQNA